MPAPIEVSPELFELAQRIVAEAGRRGASAAECVIREGRELSVAVRRGAVESIAQASGKALGVRVFRGTQAATTYSSDFGWAAIETRIAAALANAAYASPDACAGLPDAAELGQHEGDLGLYSPTLADLGPEQAVDWARRAEAAALGFDPRLTNSDGASFEVNEGVKILVNSLGFTGMQRRGSCSGSAVPIAATDGKMQRDYWFTVGREVAELEAAETVGRKAAERTLRRLGARKVPTARVPVVFDPRAARSLLGHIADAVNGEAIYRESSFLLGQLGKLVAAPEVFVEDDGCRPGGLGTSPFDGEGVPTRRTTLIEDGRLNSYLLNSYAARKLGMRTTGNASRGLAGTPGVGCGGLTLRPGIATPESIIAGVQHGLYVTDFIGFGVNTVTGDYSRGASGLWIENGELAYPVEEITVAGNLRDMLRQITAIGNDLERITSVAAPTLLIEGLTVAGS